MKGYIALEVRKVNSGVIWRGVRERPLEAARRWNQPARTPARAILEPRVRLSESRGTFSGREVQNPAFFVFVPRPVLCRAAVDSNRRQIDCSSHRRPALPRLRG